MQFKYLWITWNLKKNNKYAIRTCFLQLSLIQHEILCFFLRCKNLQHWGIEQPQQISSEKHKKGYFFTKPSWLCLERKVKHLGHLLPCLIFFKIMQKHCHCNFTKIYKFVLFKQKNHMKNLLKCISSNLCRLLEVLG